MSWVRFHPTDNRKHLFPLTKKKGAIVHSRWLGAIRQGCLGQLEEKRVFHPIRKWHARIIYKETCIWFFFLILSIQISTATCQCFSEGLIASSVTRLSFTTFEADKKCKANLKKWTKYQKLFVVISDYMPVDCMYCIYFFFCFLCAERELAIHRTRPAYNNNCTYTEYHFKEKRGREWDTYIILYITKTADGIYSIGRMKGVITPKKQNKTYLINFSFCFSIYMQHLW